MKIKILKIVSKSIFKLQKENLKKKSKKIKKNSKKEKFIKKFEFENILSKTIKKLFF